MTSARVEEARGKIARPNFSTGLASVASNNKKAAMEEITEAVLKMPKLKFGCCRKTRKV